MCAKVSISTLQILICGKGLHNHDHCSTVPQDGSLYVLMGQETLRQTCRQDISGPNRCHFITIRHKRESDIEGSQETQFGPLGPKPFLVWGNFRDFQQGCGPVRDDASQPFLKKDFNRLKKKVQDAYTVTSFLGRDGVVTTKLQKMARNQRGKT